MILTEVSLLFLWEAASLSSFESGFVPRDQEEEAAGRPGVPSLQVLSSQPSSTKQHVESYPVPGTHCAPSMQTEQNTRFLFSRTTIHLAR